MKRESQKPTIDMITPIIPIVQKKQISSEYGSFITSQNIKYYEEYKRLLQTSYVLHQRMMELRDLGSSLTQIVSKLDVSECQWQDTMNHLEMADKDKLEESSPNDKPKRFRRTNNMIEKNYKCPAQKCQKVYGSEGSLHQHIKNKHPSLQLKEEDKYAQQQQHLLTL